jgi:hypothetical protein
LVLRMYEDVRIFRRGANSVGRCRIHVVVWGRRSVTSFVGIRLVIRDLR